MSTSFFSISTATRSYSPLEAERFFFQGNAFANERRFEEAKASCRRAAALDPTDTRPLQGLADRLEADGQLDEAVALRRRIIRIGPYNARDRDRLVSLLMKQGRKQDAAAALAEDIASTTNRDRQASGHFRLGALLFDEDLLSEALEEFRSACAIDPEQGARSLLNWGRQVRGRAAPVDSSGARFWNELTGLTEGTGW